MLGLRITQHDQRRSKILRSLSVFTELRGHIVIMVDFNYHTFPTTSRSLFIVQDCFIVPLVSSEVENCSIKSIVLDFDGIAQIL